MSCFFSFFQILASSALKRSRQLVTHTWQQQALNRNLRSVVLMISKKTKPASTRICCLKTEIFSSSLAYRPHVCSENGRRKRSPEWRFLETPPNRFRVDRQKRRFFEFGDVIHKTAHTLCQATIVFSLFWRVRMNGRKRFEYVNVWTSILSKTDSKIFVFQKFLDAYGQGLRA